MTCAAVLSTEEEMGGLPPQPDVQHGRPGRQLGGLENWYYGQIARGEALAPPEYGKVLIQPSPPRKCGTC